MGRHLDQRIADICKVSNLVICENSVILLDVLTLLLQMRRDRIESRPHPPRPGQPSVR